MKKGIVKIFTGAGFLAGCSVIAKILGALYRIPLTSTLGAEGMGLYQTVFPVYTLLITLCSGGVTVAVAKLVATSLNGGDRKSAIEITKTACLTFGIIAGVLSLFVAVLSVPLATIQGNVNAYLSYIALSPAIVMVAVSSCLKGYHQGKENMLPTALSQIIEQVVKLSLGLFLASFFARYGVSWAVFGALVGVTISEIFCLSFLLLSFAFRRKIKLPKTRKNQNGGVRAMPFLPSTAEFSSEVVLGKAQIPTAKTSEDKPISALSTWQKVKLLLKTATPVAYGALVLPVTAVADSLLIVNILSRSVTTSGATALYGLLTGAVMTVINLPAVVLGSFSTALLPVVSKYGEKQITRARSEILFTLKISLSLAVICALALAVYSGEIIQFLYGSGLNESNESTGAILLALGAVSVALVSVVQVCTASLQGLGKTARPAVNLALGGVVKIAVTVLALFAFGIYGAVLGTVACYGVTALLDYRSLNKTMIGRDQKRIKPNLKSLILPAGAFIVVSLVAKILLLGVSSVLRLIVGGLLGGLVFIVSLWQSRYFSPPEKKKIGSIFKTERN